MNILDQCNELRVREEPFVLATVVAYKSPQSAKPGSKAIIKVDGSMVGWVGGGCVQPIVLREARAVLQTGKPKLLTISPDSARDDWKEVESFRMTCEGGGSLEIYLEPVLPKPQLVIVGNSPVAEALSQLGELLDFKVILADPSVVRDHITERSFVVVATMGNGDEEGLLSVLGTRPRYLGLVASEKKAKSLFAYAREKGVTDEDIGGVRCPAGLELGSETLPEIALSIMAEITRVRRTTSEPAIQAPLIQAPLISEATDPICGMTVDVANAKYTSVVNGETFYFCCLRCKETFDRPQVVGIS